MKLYIEIQFTGIDVVIESHFLGFGNLWIIQKECRDLEDSLENILRSSLLIGLHPVQ